MRKRCILIVCVMLLILPTLLVAGCLNESRDPFTSTTSLSEGKRTVSISGNSAGHTAGEQSRFELAFNNRSGDNSWQGEFLVILIDQKGIVAEIACEEYNIPARQETKHWITAEFPENFKGPIGIGVIIPGCTSMVTTLWVGKVVGNVGPWPNPYSLTQEGSKELAEKLVRNCTSFLFDGIVESLTSKETTVLLKEHKPGSPERLSNTHGWSYVFKFESRYAGYGDRNGQVLTQVITPHEEIICVEDIINNPDSFWTPEMLLDFSRYNQNAVGKPGEAFHYSDTGYVLLGRIIENVTSKPFQRNLHDEFFVPLEMNDSYLMFYSEPANQPKQPIQPIRLNDTEISQFTSLSADWAGGGIISTTADLLKFHQALRNGQLISQASLQSMNNFDNEFMPGIDYGLGMMEVNFEEFSPALSSLPQITGHIGIWATHMFYYRATDTYKPEFGVGISYEHQL